MIEPLLGVIVLFVVAGGGIIVLDWLIIRRLRRNSARAPDGRRSDSQRG